MIYVLGGKYYILPHYLDDRTDVSNTTKVVKVPDIEVLGSIEEVGEVEIVDVVPKSDNTGKVQAELILF